MLLTQASRNQESNKLRASPVHTQLWLLRPARMWPSQPAQHDSLLANPPGQPWPILPPVDQHQHEHTHPSTLPLTHPHCLPACQLLCCSRLNCSFAQQQTHGRCAIYVKEAPLRHGQNSCQSSCLHARTGTSCVALHPTVWYRHSTGRQCHRTLPSGHSMQASIRAQG